MTGEEAGSNMVGLVCPRCRAICYGPDNLKSHMVTCAGGRGGVTQETANSRRDQRPHSHSPGVGDNIRGGAVPVQSVAPAMRRGGHGQQVRVINQSDSSILTRNQSGDRLSYQSSNQSLVFILSTNQNLAFYNN